LRGGSARPAIYGGGEEMEVIINRCYGGFGLSLKAQKRYCEAKGKNVYFYEQTKYEWRDGKNEYQKVEDCDGSLFVHAVTKDYGKTISELPNDDNYFSDRDIPRDDPDLIKVVKELAGEANGVCADLAVVEIPDGIEWEIEEYDGFEWVAEKHRTWG
jgi:hypothetical protein